MCYIYEIWTTKIKLNIRLKTYAKSRDWQFKNIYDPLCPKKKFQEMDTYKKCKHFVNKYWIYILHIYIFTKICYNKCNKGYHL